MMERTTEQSAALADELREVVVQAEALLQALAEDETESIGALKQRVRESLAAARSRLADIEARASTMAQRVSTSATAYVRENPWTVAGGALATGLILGAAFIGSLRTGDRAVS